MDVKMTCAMFSVLIFLQVAVQADGIFIKPKHDAAETMPLSTHVPNEDVVNFNSAMQITHQGHAATSRGNRRRRRRKHASCSSPKSFPPVSSFSNLIEEKSGWGTLVSTVKDSPLCRKEYPILELWAGQEGDRCRTASVWEEEDIKKRSAREVREGKGSPERKWSCPTGCIYSGENEPYCLTAGTRDVCKIEKAIHDACGSNPCPQVCPYPHEQLVYHSGEPNSVNKGDLCAGPCTTWVPPKGCTMFTEGFPYTWLEGKTGWEHGEVCHVDKGQIMRQVAPDLAPDSTIRGLWRLVASSTHGASVMIETGFSSTNTDSVSREKAKAFSAEASLSASVTVTSGASPEAGGSGSVAIGFAASSGGSSSIAKTATSTIGQSESEMIAVQCPDERLTTMVTNGNSGMNNTRFHTETSMSMEYVYQWVVANADYEAKTPHFRCHRVADGIERPPQCSPQFCGNPLKNPYCAKSDGIQAGTDPNCQR